MLSTRTPSDSLEQLLEAGCARSTPPELQYESGDGAVITGRVRLLKLTRRPIPAGSPAYVKDDGRIPSGAKILVCLSFKGSRYQFAGAIEESNRRMPDATRRYERLLLSFTPPSVAEESCVLGSVRHDRVVQAGRSPRMGIGFSRWRGRVFKRDQWRISRFTAEHERRLLRRRK